MIHVLSWWLAVEILGLAALPLAWRLFRNLPDRGYPLAKPLGLLLTCYLFWISGTLGILANTRSAILLCALLVAVGSALVYVRRNHASADGTDQEGSLAPDGLVQFLRRNVRLVVANEVLFAVALGLWVLVRAYNPEISGTEKPMDFAFLNAILRSEHFPPLDPWLSGFAISYYYFGYLIVGMLTRLAAVPSEVAFNLAIALLFALTATGAFSLTYNLVARHQEQQGQSKALPTAFGALGAVFVAVMGNLEGALEVLHTRGLGTSAFWEWIDVKNLASAPVSGSWIPVDNWWWWRASRVVHDVVLGVDQEVIDEFPFFSFLLGDMHPHVLGLPFVLLALGLCLNLLWSTREAKGWELILLGLCLGGLGFLNSWDLPIYLSICVVAYGLAGYARAQGLGRRWLSDVGSFAVMLLVLCLVLYLPFWIGLRSQAGGIEPVLLVKTRLHQYLIMFGAFIYLVTPLLLYSVWRVWTALTKGGEAGDRGARRLTLACASAGMSVLVVCLLFALFKLYLIALLLLLIGGGLLALLCGLHPSRLPHVTSSATFVLVLTLVALLLTFVVEFVFLKDVFNTRMNTVFKFHYQAWVLLAVSAAFGLYYLGPWVRARQRVLSWLLVLGFVPLFLAGLVYPVLSTYSKTAGFRGPPTLDGMAHLDTAYSDDLAAIRWLRENAEGAPTIVEATGGSYTYYGRVSANTGLPTLLGWGGHELQWRGNYEEPAKREPAIETIYTSPDVEETAALLDQYDVEYVYVGPLERDTYQVSQPVLAKLESLMDVVYQQGEVTIYGRSD
jgi:YYY domain-containing protein